MQVKIAKSDGSCSTPSIQFTEANEYPVVFKWHGGSQTKAVYVSGSWDGWRRKIPLCKSTSDFTTIINLPQGEFPILFLMLCTTLRRLLLFLEICSTIGSMDVTLAAYNAASLTMLASRIQISALQNWIADRQFFTSPLCFWLVTSPDCIDPETCTWKHLRHVD